MTPAINYFPVLGSSLTNTVSDSGCCNHAVLHVPIVFVFFKSEFGLKVLT